MIDLPDGWSWSSGTFSRAQENESRATRPDGNGSPRRLNKLLQSVNFAGSGAGAEDDVVPGLVDAG